MTTLSVRFALACLMLVGSTAQAQTYFVANLTGSQEVPPNASTGIGFGRVTLNAAQTQITVSVHYSGLGTNVSMGHIHGAGAAGSNAPVLFNLSPTTGVTAGSVVNAVFNVSAQQAADLNAGLHYINIHSAGFPGGELRGQLLRSNPLTLPLSGSQEVPPVTTAASGDAVVSVNPSTNQVLITARWTGLSGNATMGHVHNAAAGTNGPVVCNLSPPSVPSGAVVDVLCAFSAAQITALNNGLFYVNIHTASNPGGEIRGQIPDVLYADGFE